MSSRGQAEVRLVTGVMLVLAGSVAACAVVPGLEHVLNVGMTWVAGGVLAVYAWLIVRDLWL